MTYLYITLSLIIFGLIVYSLIKLTHFLIDLYDTIAGSFEELEAYEKENHEKKE